MPLSKLWLLLLTIACGLCALLILSLEPELRQHEVEERAQRLVRAQGVAEQVLANQAHQLVTAAVQMSSDAILQASLLEMGRGQSELPLLHTTAQAELRRLNRDVAAALVLVADAKGRVLARVGLDEAVYRDPLDGYPIIESALRGYRLDDLWLLEGMLYRVAAVPVVASNPGGPRYVGALLLAQVVGGDVLRVLLRLTGVEGVILAGGHVLASTLSEGGAPLDAQMLLTGRSSGSGNLPVRGPHLGELLSFVDMPGEAAAQGATLVLVSRFDAARSLPLLLRRLWQRGFAQSKPLLLGLLFALVLLYVAGLSVLRAEAAALRTRSPQTPAPRTATPQPARRPTEPAAISPQLADSATAPPLMWQPSVTSEQSPTPVVPASPVAALPIPRLTPAPIMSAPPPPPPPTPEPTPSDFASGPSWGQLPPPSSNFELTRVADAAGDVADADATFYRVFQEFVLTRERCHESVEGLGYEQFRQRLLDSRAQIMRQHGCRGVDFHVYVKDGHAALRATPLW